MIEQLSRIIIPAYGDWNELIGSRQDTSKLQEELTLDRWQEKRHALHWIIY